MRLATADGETLTTALRQMSAAPRKLSGSAFWYFNRDQLVIKWTSYEQPVDIRDGTPLAGAIVVLGRAMNQLGAMMDLPMKERYYRPDLAKILGMTEGQVRYAVTKGRIQRPARRSDP